MKVRSILISFLSAAALTGFSVVTANAQTYPNPSPQDTEAARQGGPCRDPWVSLAVRQVTGSPAQGVGEFGDCNVRLYNGGTWNSYDDLARAIKLAHSRMAEGRVRYSMMGGNNSATITLLEDGEAAQVITLRVRGTEASVIETRGPSSVAIVPNASLRNSVQLITAIQGTGIPSGKEINLGKSVMIILHAR